MIKKDADKKKLAAKEEDLKTKKKPLEKPVAVKKKVQAKKTAVKKDKTSSKVAAEPRSKVEPIKVEKPVVKKEMPVKRPSKEEPVIHNIKKSEATVDVKAPLNQEPKIAAKQEAKIPPKPVMQPKVEIKQAPKVEEKSVAKPVVEVPKAQAVPVQPVASQVPIVETVISQEEAKPKLLELDLPITLKDLASKLNVKPNEIIIKLMAKSVFATINQGLGEDIVKDILQQYGFEFKRPPKLEDQLVKEHRELEEKQDVKHLATRPPVVTFMGHVDHGKTSLLDFIRKTRVADKEKGGITQHIGAYEVKLEKGSVTFLDTPGHEAFTAMRARGANATDVVVLVVAADDGVMPQTKEALDHARAAEVTIVVALNKCDLPSANIDKVKGQLSQIGLSPEDWGGKTIVAPVSAKTGEGVDHLLEMLILESELLELKANPHLRARGVVIEGRLSSGQGSVATVLVKNGTLRVGDMVVTGMHFGRVKAMMDHTGKRIEEAPPSKPVSVLGLSGVPMAGEEFFVVKDEKKAKTLSILKQDEARSRKLKSSKRITLEDFYSQMKDGITKRLSILLKGDVQGSVEAIKKSLLELNTKDVEIDIVHADVGNINESDIMLAVVSNAVVMGFNVKIDEGAQTLSSKEGIEIKNYGIIYEAIQDVAAAMEGLLEPYSKEVFVGRALVKQVFKVTKAGTIAGCQVVKGKMVRTGITKLIRDKSVVYEGKISGLKRFKDDVRDVAEGFECGIGLERHDDIKSGDTIEIYQIEKVARRLESRKK